MESSPGLHSSAHRGPPKSGIVLIYKYIYNIYVRHTERICKLIKYKKRLKKKRIGKLTRSIYYFPRLLYCLLQHKPVPNPFFISRARSGGGLCLWRGRTSPCPGLRFPRPRWGSVGWGCNASSYCPPPRFSGRWGPAVSSLDVWGAVLTAAGLSVCVSMLGTRCGWPRVLVHLWCVLSSRELSPCGHRYRDLERRVSRLDGGQR